jgi:acetolactate synthase-1/2/3 large subunit
MELITGAEILVRCLKEEGVEYMFGYPGGAVLHIYDALYAQDDVKHVLVRHEQAAAPRRRRLCSRQRQTRRGRW